MIITKEEIKSAAELYASGPTSGNYSTAINGFKAGVQWVTSKLSDKPTVAITEAAHSANTLLSEVPTCESDTHIGDVGAASSETEIVKQNEKAKGVCECTGVVHITDVDGIWYCISCKRKVD